MVRFRGITGSSKLGAFIRGKELTCYVIGPTPWTADAIGGEIEVLGEMRVFVTPLKNSENEDAKADVEPGTEVIYIKISDIKFLKTVSNIAPSK